MASFIIRGCKVAMTVSSLNTSHQTRFCCCTQGLKARITKESNETNYLFIDGSAVGCLFNDRVL